MKKYILLVLLVLLVCALGAIGFYIAFETSEGEIDSVMIPNIIEPYIRIEKNEEASSEDFTLNGSNKEFLYAFDIYNNNAETEEFSSLEITPYVKIGIKTDSEDIDYSFVSINMYSVNDISLGLQEGNFEEITTKGEDGSGFEEYFECKLLPKYDKENESNNVAHYIAKVTLNTEDENYNNLTDNIMQKLELTLGYRKKN